MQAVEVSCHNVGKAYAHKVLFANINLTVKPGECLAVTGLNGCGKSTFLKIIAGLIRPSTGVVSILADGKQLGREQQSRYIGMVSPELMLYTALTGWENIKFFTNAHGKKLTAGAINALAQTTGLGSYLRQPVSSYSSGMKQRLKLALILAVKPPLWLLDEPSTNLDAAGKALVANLITAALADKVTIILATNEDREAQYGTQRLSLA